MHNLILNMPLFYEKIIYFFSEETIVKIGRKKMLQVKWYCIFLFVRNKQLHLTP